MSKVKDWIACDLRYVAETKLSRLTDDELARLYFGLGKKHSLSITTVSADRATMIEKLMVLKKEIQVAYARVAAADKAQSAAEATKVVEEIFAPEPATEDGADAKDGVDLRGSDASRFDPNSNSTLGRRPRRRRWRAAASAFL